MELKRESHLETNQHFLSKVRFLLEAPTSKVNPFKIKPVGELSPASRS